MGGSQIDFELLIGELPSIPSGWRYEPLGSLVDERGISYGIVQPGAPDSDGVPVLRVNNVKGGQIITDDVLRVGHDIEAAYKRTRLRGGEVLLTLVGSLAESAVVPPQMSGWNLARAVGMIPVRPDVGPLWVELNLRSHLVKHYAQIWATTTVQATLNLKEVAKLPIVMPPLKERQAITAVLSALDDKIEQNRRTIETLESMARTIFKSWFVDFDPVRAKAQRRQPAGMNAETAALFPATFQGSSLGELPRGWRIATIDNIVGLIVDHRGKTPKKLGSDWSSHGIPAVSAKNIKAGHLVRRETMNLVSRELFDRWMPEKLRPGDVLLTSEAPLGELLFLARRHEFCLSQRVFGIRANPQVCCPTYLYHWLDSDNGRRELSRRETGTTVLGIRQSELRRVRLPLPPPPIHRAADRILDPIRQIIETLDEQSDTLTCIRDALLYRLLSGEIRIRDAEKAVEARV